MHFIKIMHYSVQMFLKLDLFYWLILDLQKIKQPIFVHFVTKNSTSKLLLIFIKHIIWETWIFVVYACKRGELIREDGKHWSCILQMSKSHFMKINMASTLGLQDSIFVMLAIEILENWVYINRSLHAENNWL